MDAAARHSLENGRRTVLNPIDLMLARASSVVRVPQSPCGMQSVVSMPNQDAALIVYGALFESRILPPEVCSQPVGGGVVAAEARGSEAAATPVRASPAATAVGPVRAHGCVA